MSRASGPDCREGPRRHVSSPYFGDRSRAAALDVMSTPAARSYSSNKWVKDASKAANAARNLVRRDTDPGNRDPHRLRPAPLRAQAPPTPGARRPAPPLLEDTTRPQAHTFDASG